MWCSRATLQAALQLLRCSWPSAGIKGAAHRLCRRAHVPHRTPALPPLPQASFQMRVLEDGPVDAFCGWFDTQFKGSEQNATTTEVTLSTAPDPTGATHWGQQVRLQRGAVAAEGLRVLEGASTNMLLVHALCHGQRYQRFGWTDALTRRRPAATPAAVVFPAPAH